MGKQETKVMRFVLLACLIALALSHRRPKPGRPDNNEKTRGCCNDGSSYCNIMGGRCLKECSEDDDFGVKCRKLCGYGDCTCCYKAELELEAQEGDPCGEDGKGSCKGNCSWSEMPTSDCPGGKMKCCVEVQYDSRCHLCVGSSDFCVGQDVFIDNQPCDDGSVCCQCEDGSDFSIECLGDYNLCNDDARCMNGFDEIYCPSNMPAYDDGCGDNLFRCPHCGNA